jgi:[acyl-carrier-protein] S-malonyltransferase
MQSAAERLAGHLQQINFSDASIPVVQNVDARVHTDAEGIMQALIKQLHEPVCWSQSIATMQSEGVTHVVECGPGKVLTGLCRRIDRDLDAVAVYDKDSLESALSRELT